MAPARPECWWHSALVGLALAVCYGLLWTRHWVPETDGAVYLSVARNWYNGHDFEFNGVLPVIIPPLWPILLAGLFHLSAAFGFLNLVSLITMVACGVVWHRILLRLTRPPMAMAIALVSAMTWDWFRLSSLPFTDPPALLALSTAMLLALQMRESDHGSWRIPLLVLLVGAAVLLRYAAVLGILLVVGALIHGERRPRFHASWLTAILCLLVGLAILIWVRQLYGWMVLNNSEGTWRGGGGLAVAVTKHYSLLPAQLSGPPAYLRQVLSMGSWITVLLCAPARMVARMDVVGWVVPAAGWVLGGCFMSAVWSRRRGERWIGLGAALYVAVIAMRWPDLNTRYLVPVLPVLLLGIAEGVEGIVSRLRSDAGTVLPRRVKLAFLAAVAVANVLLYASRVQVARAADFYAAFRGEAKQIVDIGHALLERGVSDGEVAVTYRFFEEGVGRPNQYAIRALVLLTGRRIRAAPARYDDPPNSPGFRAWAAANHVRYLVHRPSLPVERIWGLAMPRVVDWLRGRQGVSSQTVYELYQIADGPLQRMVPSAAPHWPQAVPALARRDVPRSGAPRDGGQP
jgi:hypothetical protein